MIMENQYWWLLAGILLFLIEIFTPSFFAASLAIGAFASAIFAWMGFNLEWQLFVLSIVSLASMFLLRPIIKNKFYTNKETKSNADAIIGRTGKVVQAIGSEMGRVAIDGDEWQCHANGSEVALGTMVRVIERESIILTVEPLNN